MLKCQQCKIVEMRVKKVNEGENKIEYVCPKCGEILERLIKT